MSSYFNSRKNDSLHLSMLNNTKYNKSNSKLSPETEIIIKVRKSPDKKSFNYLSNASYVKDKTFQDSFLQSKTKKYYDPYSTKYQLVKEDLDEIDELSYSLNFRPTNQILLSNSYKSIDGINDFNQSHVRSSHLNDNNDYDRNSTYSNNDIITSNNKNGLATLVMNNTNDKLVNNSIITKNKVDIDDVQIKLDESTNSNDINKLLFQLSERKARRSSHNNLNTVINDVNGKNIILNTTRANSSPNLIDSNNQTNVNNKIINSNDKTKGLKNLIKQIKQNEKMKSEIEKTNNSIINNIRLQSPADKYMLSPIAINTPYVNNHLDLTLDSTIDKYSNDIEYTNKDLTIDMIDTLDITSSDAKSAMKILLIVQKWLIDYNSINLIEKLYFRRNSIMLYNHLTLTSQSNNYSLSPLHNYELWLRNKLIDISRIQSLSDCIYLWSLYSGINTKIKIFYYKKILRNCLTQLNNNFILKNQKKQKVFSIIINTKLFTYLSNYLSKQSNSNEITSTDYIYKYLNNNTTKRLSIDNYVYDCYYKSIILKKLFNKTISLKNYKYVNIQQIDETIENYDKLKLIYNMRKVYNQLYINIQSNRIRKTVYTQLSNKIKSKSVNLLAFNLLTQRYKFIAFQYIKQYYNDNNVYSSMKAQINSYVKIKSLRNYLNRLIRKRLSNKINNFSNIIKLLNIFNRQKLKILLNLLHNKIDRNVISLLNNIIDSKINSQSENYDNELVTLLTNQAYKQINIQINKLISLNYALNRWFYYYNNIKHLYTSTSSYSYITKYGNCYFNNYQRLYCINKTDRYININKCNRLVINKSNNQIINTKYTSSNKFDRYETLLKVKNQSYHKDTIIQLYVKRWYNHIYYFKTINQFYNRIKSRTEKNLLRIFFISWFNIYRYIIIYNRFKYKKYLNELINYVTYRNINRHKYITINNVLNKKKIVNYMIRWKDKTNSNKLFIYKIINKHRNNKLLWFNSQKFLNNLLSTQMDLTTYQSVSLFINHIFNLSVQTVNIIINYLINKCITNIKLQKFFGKLKNFQLYKNVNRQINNTIRYKRIKKSFQQLKRVIFQLIKIKTIKTILLRTIFLNFKIIFIQSNKNKYILKKIFNQFKLLYKRIKYTHLYNLLYKFLLNKLYYQPLQRSFIKLFVNMNFINRNIDKFMKLSNHLKSRYFFNQWLYLLKSTRYYYKMIISKYMMILYIKTNPLNDQLVNKLTSSTSNYIPKYKHLTNISNNLFLLNRYINKFYFTIYRSIYLTNFSINYYRTKQLFKYFKKFLNYINSYSNKYSSIINKLDKKKINKFNYNMKFISKYNNRYKYMNNIIKLSNQPSSFNNIFINRLDSKADNNLKPNHINIPIDSYSSYKMFSDADFKLDNAILTKQSNQFITKTIHLSNYQSNNSNPLIKLKLKVYLNNWVNYSIKLNKQKKLENILNNFISKQKKFSKLCKYLKYKKYLKLLKTKFNYLSYYFSIFLFKIRTKTIDNVVYRKIDINYKRKLSRFAIRKLKSNEIKCIRFSCNISKAMRFYRFKLLSYGFITLKVYRI